MIAIVKSCRLTSEEILQRSLEGRSRPDALAILKRWFSLSEGVWYGMYNNEVLCVWGLAPLSIVSDHAYLWLLTTDAVEDHKFLFVRHSQLVIEEALREYNSIVGHVGVGNDSARKWLRWLGAKIGPPSNGYSSFRIGRK